MKLILMLLVALQVPGVLSGPDPAQMEKAPPLGYHAVQAELKLPEGMKMGAPSSVAVTRNGNLLVFNRGRQPLMEFDAKGALVRAFGEGMYVRPHGMRIDPEGLLRYRRALGAERGPAGRRLPRTAHCSRTRSWPSPPATGDRSESRARRECAPIRVKPSPL